MSEKIYPPVDPDILHAATMGILTGIMYGYNLGDPEIPKPGSNSYNFAHCVATDAVRAANEWRGA